MPESWSSDDLVKQQCDETAAVIRELAAYVVVVNDQSDVRRQLYAWWHE